MLRFKRKLKGFARELRKNPTDAEFKLWQNIRAKRLKDCQFYRQKNLGNYIVDFYCPAGKLILNWTAVSIMQKKECELMKSEISIWPAWDLPF